LQYKIFAVQQGRDTLKAGRIPLMSKSKSARPRASARTPAVFPAPDHDHERCSSDAMALAEALCAKRGQRLTPIRRKVLAALLASHKPLGAYEIIDRLAPRGPRPAPITAYRALEFLRENGLVHRIESRNAFIACVHTHAAGDLVVFLICERCGTVGEASSADVAATLTSAARAAGFTPKSPVIEISGICTHCRGT
jgi:Fur family transcriptional regulator, zinc uptake regulator